MALEINIDGKSVSIELLNETGNRMKYRVDGKVYDVDLVMVENGVYSILYNNKSYNVELIQGKKPKTYIINTLYNSYNIDILDAEAKYLNSRQHDHLHEDNIISTPMPGKVVRILVKKGDKVRAGQTVIIVSAMKMESEFRVKKDRIIRDILVNEGDTVDGNQPLIKIE
ncbi:MAG: biotin/lipoyl-binding protein [Bacteroidales bacterium]|nr:biotin/lipoyl-binding protein [Bacteroidales bacterium]